jgi:hypothetical protein
VKKRHFQRGQVLPLIALCLAVLLGFAGFAVDIGYLQYELRQQQTAADAAAIGGARELITAGCGNSASATSAGINDATQNGFTDGSNGVTVTINNPPATGSLTSNNCAVQAVVFSPHATFFGKLFGFVGDETTTATALLASSPLDGCIYLLQPSGTANFNGSTVNSTCGILLNTNAPNFNSSNVTAPGIGYSGSAPNEIGATFAEATPGPMLPVADPCPTITGCAYLANNPPTLGVCSSFNGNGYVGNINPGCYTNLNLSGATVTLNAGTYILAGSTNFNGATLTSASGGVTFYVTASGTAPNFNSVTSASLSPPPVSLTPSAGTYPGVLYYQVPSNTTNPNFNGTKLNLNGLIYAPGASSANFNGGRGNYLVLVFGGANFNGSFPNDFSKSAAGQGLIRQPTLAE